MGILTNKNPHGVVQVRVNRTSKSDDGFWHKHSDYYGMERIISNIVTSEGLTFQGFAVKPEKVKDMTAEIRLQDDLFEQLYDYFQSDELEFKQASGLIFTFNLASTGELGKLTIQDEEVTSWTFYPDEILDVQPAARQPNVTVAGQNELDDLLAAEGEKARRKREKAVAAIRASSMAQMNAATLGLVTEPATTETIITPNGSVVTVS